jgi:predicted HicB family RNase H-like nuclease
MNKKIYESKKNYSIKYNKLHKSIRVEKELYEKLKDYLKDKDISIKDHIEKLIKDSIS